MSEVADLAEWLLEQIAEDDRQVRGPGRPSILGLPRRWIGRVWLPSRIRDECTAKRKIIELYRSIKVDDQADRAVQQMQRAERSALLEAIRLLAVPSSFDRPGYREEWRP